MAYADTLYTARLALDTLERGRANLIKCPVYRDGALVAPASGTVTVYDASGTAVVAAAVVTVTASVAGYSVSSSVLASYDYGDGWRIEWVLTMPDGVAHTFVCEAALTRRRLYPVVTDADLIARVPGLSPSATQRLTRSSTYQDRLDEAWRILTQRLLGDGNVPWWVADPTAFRETHLTLTLSMIFGDLAVYSEAAGSLYADEAQRYRDAYEAAYRVAHTRILRDADASQTRRRVSPSPTLWTTRLDPWHT